MDIAQLPLFRSLDAAEVERATQDALLKTFAADETVVERWDASREFFVIVSGEARVTIANEFIRTLGPGDFFGELAALDWGDNFHYPRLATVVAATPLEVLVFPGETIPELVREFPSIGKEIRATGARRFSRRP